MNKDLSEKLGGGSKKGTVMWHLCCALTGDTHAPVALCHTSGQDAGRGKTVSVRLQVGWKGMEEAGWLWQH